MNRFCEVKLERNKTERHSRRTKELSKGAVRCVRKLQKSYETMFL